MAKPAAVPGATVRMVVPFTIRGVLLHALEYLDDIFLIDRRATSMEREEETWLLRSDAFPASWNDRYVSARLDRENGSIEFRCGNDRVRVKRKAQESPA